MEPTNIDTSLTIQSAPDAYSTRRGVPVMRKARSAGPHVRIGLALGGGFARGIAHVGVLKAFEEHGIPIHCITGVSAGAIVAAAYASGATVNDIARVGCSMRFGDIGRLGPRRLGLATSDPMDRFLTRLLKRWRFEEMRVPLGVLATDLSSGEPVCFSGTGHVVEPLRASCAYPGLFEPVRHGNRLLVDGAMSMAVPATLARQLGATHVVSITVPASPTSEPANVFQVVTRCFQILQGRCDESWRRDSDAVIAPNVRGVHWRAFDLGSQLISEGEAAALRVLPLVQQWLAPAEARVQRGKVA